MAEKLNEVFASMLIARTCSKIHITEISLRVAVEIPV